MSDLLEVHMGKKVIMHTVGVSLTTVYNTIKAKTKVNGFRQSREVEEAV
jgi:hypothetical protein